MKTTTTAVGVRIESESGAWFFVDAVLDEEWATWSASVHLAEHSAKTFDEAVRMLVEKAEAFVKAYRAAEAAEMETKGGRA
jgi:hypothetical protein